MPVTAGLEHHVDFLSETQFDVALAHVCTHRREILQEIQRLRLQHEEASQPPPDRGQQNPTLLAELRLLR